MNTSPPAASETGESPKSPGTKALTAVPVVLTVLATILAGLSSSEMTRSMFYRSLAAQNQAKAGSQWAFFQAKRIRGTTIESTSELVRALSEPSTTDAQQLVATIGKAESAIRASIETFQFPSTAAARDYAKKAEVAADQFKAARAELTELVNNDKTSKAVRMLTTGALPAVAERHSENPALREVVSAVRSRQTEAQTAAAVVRISPEQLDEAIAQSEGNAAAFETACQPIVQVGHQLEAILSKALAIWSEIRELAATWPDSQRALNAAGNGLKNSYIGLRVTVQDYTARRYAKEANYNQETAELYEVLVRRNGAESDRHRDRSKNFFYAMLCAQAGVTIASLALAKSRMSAFWAIAGLAGILALALGVYVYLAM